MPESVILRRRPLPPSTDQTDGASSLITARRPLPESSAPTVDEGTFRQWYAEKAKQYGLGADPDAPDQFYDYRAAFMAGARPDDTGHWPSQFKKPGHPNEIVGGFNTRTGERVPGTPRASEQELVAQGWDPPTAQRLAASPEPGAKRSMAAMDPWAGTLEGMVGGQDREDAALRDVGGDLAITGVKSAISVPEAAMGLADLATMGAAGKIAETAGFQPKEARRILDSWYSERYQKARQDVADATGVLATAAKALQHPDVILHSVLESIPLMLAGGVAGRTVGAGLGLSAETAGAVGEGLASAGSAAEQIRQETPGGILSLGQVATAATIGGATGGLSKLGGFIAGKLGIDDVDTLVAATAADPQARKNLVRAVLEGAFTEGVLEELPQSVVEQVLQNHATGRPLSEGVDHAAVLGSITGGVMGIGAQLVGGGHGLAGQRPPAPPSAPPAPPPADVPAPVSVAPQPPPVAPQAPMPEPPAAASPVTPDAPPSMGEVLGRATEPVEATGGAAPVDVEALLAEADQLDAKADRREKWNALRDPEKAREMWGFEPVPFEQNGETVYGYSSGQNGISPKGEHDGNLDDWISDQVSMGYSDAEVRKAVLEAERRGIDPTRSDDLHDLGNYMDGLDAAREEDGLPALKDLPDDEPTIEVLDPEGTIENASGESAASAEALSRQEGMKSRGEQFVVYDRAGNRRVLIGPEAVDYEAKPGETYGVDTPEGFRLLDDRGGKVPTGSSPAVLTDEDRAVLESMGQDEAAENAEAIDITPKADDVSALSDDELTARVLAEMERRNAPAPPAEDDAPPQLYADRVALGPEGQRKALRKLMEPFAKKNGLTRAEAEEYEDYHRELTNTYFNDDPPDSVPAGQPLSIELLSQVHEAMRRSLGVYEAINEASAGTYHDALTPLDKIVKGEWPGVAPGELKAAFEPVRQSLRQRYGDTMTLYRAATQQREKPTKNYAFDRATALKYGKDVTEQKVNVDDIVAVNIGPTGKYLEFVVATEKPAATAPAGATITRNAERKSVEVKFPGKPDEAIRERLKKAGFRWAKTTGTWYSGRPGAEEAAYAITGQKRPSTVQPGPSPLDTFEAEGKEPWQVTRAEWVAIQRGHRRHLGQNEDGGPVNAPNADYEMYHRMAVRDAIAAGRDVPQAVRDELRAEMEPPARKGATPQVPNEPGVKYGLPSFATGRGSVVQTEAPKPAKKATTKPAAEKSKPAKASDHIVAIGKNAEGQTVYEDGNGVRSVVVDGVRRSEPVGMVPRRVTNDDGSYSTQMGMSVSRDADGNPTRHEYRVVKERPQDAVNGVGEEPFRLGETYDGEEAAVKAVGDAGRTLVRLERVQRDAAGHPYRTPHFRAYVTPRTEADIARALEARTKAPEDPTEAKRAALAAKRAKAKAEIAEAAEQLRAELRKAGNTLNSGLPMPPPAVVARTVSLIRAYSKVGIVTVEEGWLSFREDMGELAAQARQAFQIAWGMIHGTEPALTDLPVEDSDGEGDRGSADGGQLPAAGGESADAAGAEGAGALEAVPAEDVRGAGDEAGPRGAKDGAPGGIRDRGDGGEDRPVAGGDRADVPRPALSPTGNGERNPGHAVGDYQLTPERIAAVIERGAMERARDNVRAIQLVKELMAEKRHATAEEQETLAKFVGWGDINVARFLDESPDYSWRKTEKAVWKEVQDSTTPDERKALRRSTLNAHYTFDIYKPLWEALQRAGFAYGRVLEPAVGTGHAFGFMPAEMRQLSTLNAVELEPQTAAIAQALYPSARVQTSGYEKSRIARGTQDLVVSNVPFGAYGVTDRKMPDFITERIHNYFFAKALDHVRPGGIVAFITTHHTMDNESNRVRRYLMNKAHFLGAVRLPNTAFGKGAKTEVVTDLVFLQRKLDEKDEARNAAAFLATVDTDAGRRSEWYEAHPELILGKEARTGKMYGRPDAYNVEGEGELAPKLAEALAKVLPPGTYTPAAAATGPVVETLEAAEGARHGELSIEGTKVYRVTKDGKLEEVKEKGATLERLKGMIRLRSQLADLRGLMRSADATDAQITKSQKALKAAYDKFHAAHGLLNSAVNRRLFSTDPEAANLLALEVMETKAEYVPAKDGTQKLKITRVAKGLADIFTKRTIRSPREAIKADTPKSALLASLAMHVGINWPYMAEVSGKSVSELQAALRAEGRVFQAPDGKWFTDDEYLSGDVVSKLDDAEAAGDEFRANVEALKRVQPLPKKPEDIRIALGAHWVPAKHFRAFMADYLGVSLKAIPELVRIGTSEMGKWIVPSLSEHEAMRSNRANALTVEYGPGESEQYPFGRGYAYTPWDLLSDAMNLKVPAATWTVKSGDSTVTMKSEGGTLAARGNLDALQAEWEGWVQANAEVRDALTATFNDRFNREVPRTFDGEHLREHLRDNGLSLPFELHKHQVDAIWRALATGNTLLAHEVGAGKTFEMIATAMEMRRTGRARKPMITVPTYLLGQWRDDILRAYPSAKVLAFDTADLDAKKRQQAMARIAFGDWDIVLVPHSSFELLQVSPERMTSMLERMVNEIMDVERETAEREGKKSKNLKQLAQMRAKLETKIESLLDRAKKGNDGNLTWEDLGVDALLVDEAHAFKNLYFFSNMDNVRGISRSNSDRALSMLVKVQEINEQSRHRNLVFATATPVMNSLVEIYTMQRYLQPEVLDEQGLKDFDNWYRMYGKAVPRVEQRPDGSYQEVLRVAEFRNLEHLSATVRRVMDYVGWPDMPYLKLPKLTDDKIHIVQTPRHPMYDAVLKPWFSKRLAILKAFPPKYDHRKKEYIAPDRINPMTGNPTSAKDNVLTVMTDARKAAIDARLVLGSAATDFKDSRIQTAADRIWKSYKKEKSRKGVQLVFLDQGTPKKLEPLEFMQNVTIEADEPVADDVDEVLEDDESDDSDVVDLSGPDQEDLYNALKSALVKRGIPSREIAFIHQAKNAGERSALFTAAQEGRVRVVLASTDKGGVGMNIQHRLSDIHELDVPRAMRPGDIRQRHGRGIRQGNMYERLTIHRYVTQGTTDEWLYGLIGAKQDLVERFMRGEATEFSEPDPTTMSVEEAQMRASGDPRGAELIDLKAKFGRMKAQASAALRAMAQAKFDKGTLANRIASLTKAAERASEFFSNTYKSQRGDGFELKLGDTAYEKRDEANTALIERLRAFGDKYTGWNDIASEDIGVIGGVDLSAEWVPPPRWSNATNGTVKLVLVAYGAGEQDDVAVASELEPGPELAAGRNIVQTLVNRYEDLAGNSQRLQAEIVREEAALKRAEDLLANPPAVIARAEAAQERITALEKELKAESEAKEKEAAAGAQEAVNAMRARAMPAPSGDASVSLTPLAPRPGVAASLGITPATQMGITTAHPAQVPEIVAFIDQVGGKTAILKKLRSLGARGFHSEGKITLLAALFEAGNKTELARVLAHEVGHLVDWLPDGDMKRGNLLGRLRSLHSFLKHRYTAVDGDTIKVEVVRNELIALSKAWREWPDDAPAAYHAYRRRGRELYADAISALLNDPDVVQQHAPTFFREFFNELDEKPEVKRAYVEMMDVLSGTPEELRARRRGRVRAMFDTGNTAALDLAKLKILEREAQGRSLWQRLRIQHVDRNTALLDRIADYEKQHGTLAPSDNPKYLLEEQVHIGATAKAFADKYFEPIYAALNKADVDWNTFGEVLFYDRIAAGDRSETANPQGLSPDDVTAMRDDALAELSRAQRDVLETAANDFRAALREVAERAYNAGLYTDEMYAQMKENPKYVTFRVLEYLDQNVTSTVHRQVGTLKDIQHVAESSILKAIVTLKAAEHNNVKRGVFRWFDDHLPGEFATAPSRWNGRGHEPAPPKDRKLRLVTYKVKGKTVGKYVDPWVALSFEQLGPTELNAGLSALNWLTSKWLRPVFTTMNPGFMSFNAMRDFLRMWKNMPGMSLRKAVRRYAQGVPLAVARAFPLKPGQDGAQWRRDAQRALADAEDAKILDLTLADVFGKDDLEGTNIDQIFADIGVSSYAAQKGRLKRAVGWVEVLGDFIETLPKAAALVELTGGDLSKIGTLDPEQRSLVRNRVGSPDFLQMGSQSRQLSNVIFLFSNAIIQGTKADVAVATNPTTAAGWWWKTALVNVAPKMAVAAVVLAALKSGDDDDDDENPVERVARILSGVSEYDLANYNVIPLGLTSEGESVYLRLPQDDTGRFVGALAWKAIGMASGDKDAMNTLLQAFDVTAGQMPGVNPLLRVPADFAAFASGNNVYDPFRSRMLFTPDELAARDEHTLKKFVGYEFQQLGGGIVWRFTPGEQRPESKSALRNVVEFPLLSNIVGRWLRVGNRGRVEKLMESTGAVKQDEARTRLDEKDEVNAAIRTLMATAPPDRKRVTKAQVDAIMKSVYPSLTGETADRKRQALTRKLGFGVLRSGPDDYVDSLLSATSNAQKAEVVRRAKRDMTPPAFSSWLKKARAEGVVSDAVAKAAGKER